MGHYFSNLTRFLSLNLVYTVKIILPGTIYLNYKPCLMEAAKFLHKHWNTGLTR